VFVTCLISRGGFELRCVWVAHTCTSCLTLSLCVRVALVAAGFLMSYALLFADVGIFPPAGDLYRYLYDGSRLLPHSTVSPPLAVGLCSAFSAIAMVSIVLLERSGLDPASERAFQHFGSARDLELDRTFCKVVP